MALSEKAKVYWRGMTAIGLFQLFRWCLEHMHDDDDNLGPAAFTATSLIKSQLEQWKIEPREFVALEVMTFRNTREDPSLDEQQRYEGFRLDLREALVVRGWEITSSDEESDYLAMGRLEVYACPADALGPPFHRVVIIEHPSQVLRRKSATTGGLVGGVEPVGICHAYSLETALSRIGDCPPEGSQQSHWRGTFPSRRPPPHIFGE